MRRRSVLAGLGAVPLAGCAGGGRGAESPTPSGEAVVDVEVFSADIEGGSFVVSILRDGAVVDELELSGPTRAREDPRIGPGVFATGLPEVEYAIVAVVETPDGTTEGRFEWDAATCPWLVLDVLVEASAAVSFRSRCEPKTGTPSGREPGERASLRPH